MISREVIRLRRTFLAPRVHSDFKRIGPFEVQADRAAGSDSSEHDEHNHVIDNVVVLFESA